MCLEVLRDSRRECDRGLSPRTSWCSSQLSSSIKFSSSAFALVSFAVFLATCKESCTSRLTASACSILARDRAVLQGIALSCKGSRCHRIQFVNSIYVTPQSDDIFNNLGWLLNHFFEEGFHCSQSCERVLVRHEQAGVGLLQVDYTPGDGRG